MTHELRGKKKIIKKDSMTDELRRKYGEDAVNAARACVENLAKQFDNGEILDLDKLQKKITSNHIVGDVFDK